MVDAEKHKLKSNALITVDELNDKKSDADIEVMKKSVTLTKDDGELFETTVGYTKHYLESNFKKEVTVYDIVDFCLMIGSQIIITESESEITGLLKDITEILTDKSALNEYFFKHIAIIKAWCETARELNSKKDEYADENKREKAFNELMDKNNSKWQYKAWQDEKAVLDKLTEKGVA